jgi:hypothetical protein
MPFETPSAPLSPARDALRSAQQQLREALAAAAEPANRLRGHAAEIERLEAELSELRHVHNVAVGAWLAAGDPTAERPAIDPRAVGIEQRLMDLHKNSAGVAAALDGAVELENRSAEAVRLHHGERDAALMATVGEACEHILRDFRAAMLAAVKVEAKLVGLLAELRRMRLRHPCRPPRS